MERWPGWHWRREAIACPVCERICGKCEWQIRSCPPEPAPPPATCTQAQCGPNPYGMPNYLCKDGSVAGPVCDTENGVCGWHIRSCPALP
jgi:hypothetical protein